MSFLRNRKSFSKKEFLTNVNKSSVQLFKWRNKRTIWKNVLFKNANVILNMPLKFFKNESFGKYLQLKGQNH